MDWHVSRVDCEVHRSTQRTPTLQHEHRHAETPQSSLTQQHSFQCQSVYSLEVSEHSERVLIRHWLVLRRESRLIVLLFDTLAVDKHKTVGERGAPAHYTTKYTQMQGTLHPRGRAHTPGSGCLDLYPTSTRPVAPIPRNPLQQVRQKLVKSE